MRGLGVIVGAWTVITKAATLATWLWNSALIRTAAGGMVALLMKIPLLRNALVGLTLLLEGAGYGAAFLDFMMVAVPVIIGLLVYAIYRLLKHFKLLNPALKALGWLFENALVKPLESTYNWIKNVIIEFGKLAKLIKSHLHLQKLMGGKDAWFAPPKISKMPFLNKPMHHFNFSGLLPTKTAVSEFVNPIGSLSTSIAGALKEAFPTLNEGLKPNITVNVNGQKVLAPEHAGHFGGAYHVDLGLNMPLSGA